MAKLRITLVQSHLHWEAPEENRNHLDALISKAKETDIFILPELFSTAFSVTCQGEAMNGESMNWMSKLAQQKQASVVGSLIIAASGLFVFQRNR